MLYNTSCSLLNGDCICGEDSEKKQIDRKSSMKTGNEWGLDIIGSGYNMIDDF
jgi:hypothetical protein